MLNGDALTPVAEGRRAERQTVRIVSGMPRRRPDPRRSSRSAIARRTEDERADSLSSGTWRGFSPGLKYCTPRCCVRLVLDQLHRLLVDRLRRVRGRREHRPRAIVVLAAELQREKAVESAHRRIVVTGGERQLLPRGDEAAGAGPCAALADRWRGRRRILGPGHPRLVDLEVVEVRLRFFQMPLRWSWCSWVRITRSRCRPVDSPMCSTIVARSRLSCEERLRAGLVAAVDQHVDGIAATVARQREEEAVAVTLPVHPHGDAAVRRLKLRHRQSSSSWCSSANGSSRVIQRPAVEALSEARVERVPDAAGLPREEAPHALELGIVGDRAGRADHAPDLGGYWIDEDRAARAEDEVRAGGASADSTCVPSSVLLDLRGRSSRAAAA